MAASYFYNINFIIHPTLLLPSPSSPPFSLLLLLFFLLLSTYVFAEEEWTITKFDKLVNAAVSGEVTHGDTLNFFIRSEDNCEKVWNTFYEEAGEFEVIRKIVRTRLQIWE